MDGIDSILVLEDDACWLPSFSEEVKEFLSKVPADWEGIFLGGQNMSEPHLVGDGLGISRNTQRTHAVAFSGDGIKKAYMCIAGADRHIDHRLGPETGKWKTCYQPTTFLIGQAEGNSDISGRRDTKRFWRKPERVYPVCWIQCPKDVINKLFYYGFHRGNDRTRDGRDRGLAKCFPERGRFVDRVGTFLGHLSWECASFSDVPGIVTIWDPNADDKVEKQLMKRLPKNTKKFKFSTFEEGLEILKKEYGDEMVFPRRDLADDPVVLLRCPMAVLERLVKDKRIHVGNWRDTETGLDMGLCEFFNNRGSSLAHWYKVLKKETKQTGALVCVYHPKATEDICKTTGQKVVVVEADNYKECLEKILECRA